VKGKIFREVHVLNPSCFDKHQESASVAILATKHQTRKKTKQTEKNSTKGSYPTYSWPDKIEGCQYKIGIDMSLKSPGIACTTTDKKGDKHVICAFIPQRIRERHMIIQDGNFYGKALNPVDPKDTQVNRMVDVAKQVAMCVTKLKRNFDVVEPVTIEGYPFAKVSSSSSVLYELGGMLRLLLTEAGISFASNLFNIKVVDPTSNMSSSETKISSSFKCSRVFLEDLRIVATVPA
jgi:hypothetical protein